MFRSLCNKFVAASALAATALLAACGGGGSDGPGGLMATVTSETAQSAGGTAVFYFDFSEPLAAGSFSTADINFACSPTTCVSGNLVLTGPAGNRYTLTVTPPAGTATVTVSLKPQSVSDVAGNLNVDQTPNVVAVIGDESTPQGTVTTPDTVGVFDFEDPCVGCYSVGAFGTSSSSTSTLITPTTEAPGNRGKVIKVVEDSAAADFAGTFISYTSTAGVKRTFDFATTAPAKMLIRARVWVPSQDGTPGHTQGVRVLLKVDNGAVQTVRCTVSSGVATCIGKNPDGTNASGTYSPTLTSCTDISGSTDKNCPNNQYKSCQFERPTTSTISGNQWQTLDFNFADTSNSTLSCLNNLVYSQTPNTTAGTYNTAIFVFNNGVAGSATGGSGTYYIDELTLPQ